MGILFAIAWFLCTYRGDERQDDVAGNLTCLFALGVALFPNNGSDGERVCDGMRTLPRPRYLPPYATLAADPQGDLWAGLSFPGDTTGLLRGVGRDGRVIADVVLPAGVSVLEVGMDYVLGILEDETGELHVVVLSLSTRAASTREGDPPPAVSGAGADRRFPSPYPR